ncbi:hypothetical protein GQ43DRAFT_474644 [Delitschia confertaspora ATCC 74209]|uniref:lytic cellulose monooxygenase (C4-dehydrogenating) n=1 Tax=Delitschia confertaspora ATCC 74209 TaxID=1513339 RepID=A0A9P4MVU1_9PLEO|nr:hypothetical protein GQ43DRAFT_474644 [Delitschia confertaspora ATCC 74209]
MKTKSLLISLLALIQTTNAHYTFAHLIVNDTITPKWKYVRDVAGDPKYASAGEYAKTAPFKDIYSANMICGRESGSGPKTSVATVIAGSELGFRIATDIGGNADAVITHEGPGQVYMSKAPNDDVEHYDGKGDWFKIAAQAQFNDTTYLLYGEKEMRFLLPESTPPGKYLLRIEQFQPSDQLGESQWYVNCAQIDVRGPGGANPPTGFVRFPGGYDMFDTGIWITQAQQNHQKLMDYYPPGPDIWYG